MILICLDVVQTSSGDQALIVGTRTGSRTRMAMGI